MSNEVVISWNTNDSVLFTVKPDGTIERGPAFTTNDEASLVFWDTVERSFPEWARARAALSAGDQ